MVHNALDRITTGLQQLARTLGVGVVYAAIEHQRVSQAVVSISQPDWCVHTDSEWSELAQHSSTHSSRSIPLPRRCVRSLDVTGHSLRKCVVIGRGWPQPGGRVR